MPLLPGMPPGKASPEALLGFCGYLASFAGVSFWVLLELYLASRNFGVIRVTNQ
jgi:hypothetical protein